MKLIEDFVSLFFPRYCLSCGESLYKGETSICLHCYSNMARTDSHVTDDNYVSRKFYGKLPIEKAFSFLLYQKGGISQRILHKIKYDNMPEIAVELGKRYGLELKDIINTNEYTCLVPVPLHYSKLRQRGYNQSAKFAEGLAEAFKLPVIHTLRRVKASATQTKKSRLKRWQNVEDIFEDTGKLSPDAKVLLVDDVITTGSTLEACATTLINNGYKVGVITLAAAK